MLGSLKCVSLGNKSEHGVSAPIAYPPEMHLPETLDGFIVRLGVSPIQEETPHTVPPDSMPVIFTSSWVLAVLSVSHDAWLLSCYNATMFIQDSFGEYKAGEHLHTHLSTVNLGNLSDRNLHELSESKLKEAWSVIGDSELNEIDRMETPAVCFDAVNDESLGLRALELVAEGDETCEFLLAVSALKTRAASSQKRT